MSKNALAMMTAFALIAAPACYDAEDDAELEGGLEDEVGETAYETEDDPYGVTRGAPADRAEWDAWWSERRAEFDTDGDEGLSQDEFQGVVVGLWDTDGDDRVSTEEWSQASSRWLQGSQTPWTEWDGDGDGYLNEDEVGEGIENAGLFDRVDRDGDGTIDENELSEWYLLHLDQGGMNR